MDYINGMEVIKNNLFVKDSRQKRIHKSKRINKKWRKKYGFADIPDKQVYIMDNKIFGHPITINKMLRFMKSKEVTK